jgi:secondary thiamine-phosphate synthase enzyme
MFTKFSVTTHSRCELVDITAIVQEIVSKSGAESAVCFIYTPHTTSGIAINENADPDVAADIGRFLSKLVPKDKGFSHVEGNSDAHIKSCLCGNSRTVFVEEGSLRLGRWEGIYFTEFDGPRTREVWIKIIKG